jgi:transaldolase
VVVVEKDKMVSEASGCQIHDNIVVKVPLTEDGSGPPGAAGRGIRVNVTLCFSVTQAHLAAKAGASHLALVGRIDDISGDGGLDRTDPPGVRTMRFATEILAASIRHPQHVVQSLLLGDCATMP